MTSILDVLPPVSPAQHDSILQAPRTAAAHQALLRDVPAMHALEVGGAARLDRLPANLTVAAWNVERCLFPEDSAALLGRYQPDLVLLSEMDCGMARTGQRNTTAVVAAELGMHYAFGVEFYEMDLGSPIERDLSKDDHNMFGWHGNALLSSAPFTDLALFRLDDRGHWFVVDGDHTSDPNQPRLGTRMAIAARVETSAGSLCVVSTHLESNADATYRHEQFALLLSQIDTFAGDSPILIGGDLNTGNHIPPDYSWEQESLFALAEDQGYNWDLTPPGITTRPSSLSPGPRRSMRLDWFCARGLGGKAGPLVPAVSGEGRALSDHECIVCHVDLTLNGHAG